jgi:hypothetical protein
MAHSHFVAACKYGLVNLPSGAKYCHTPVSNMLPREEADAYCKKIGLSGLLELETADDYIYFGGFNICKLRIAFNSFPQKQGDQMSLWKKIAQNVSQHLFGQN